MPTDRLKLYNRALQICQVRGISSLTVNEESRRELDIVWNDDGVEKCLEQGMWRFARRTSKFSYDTAITPTFGYRRAFRKPDDYLNTVAVCSDEYFNAPLNQYSDEAGFWYADIDEIYVKYTSNDSNYGLNFAGWSKSFQEFVATYLASRVVLKLTGNTDMAGAILKPHTGLLDRALALAKNMDAQGDPAKFLPEGGWVRSRRGRHFGSTWGDGGSRSRLVG